MQIEQLRNKILEGNAWHTMFSLSIPSVVGFLLLGLNTLLDGLFVGYFVGEKALAGITLAYPLTQLLGGFANLIGIGTANILSVNIGKGDKQSVSEQLGDTLIISFIVSIPIMLVGYIGAPNLIGLMGITGPSYIYGLEYFRAIAIGTLFLNVAMGLNFMLRAEGNMKEAMILFGLGVFLNAVLNPIFIKTLGWGVAGSAWATNISMLFSAVMHYVYIYRKRKGVYNFAHFHLKRNSLIAVLTLGLPSLLLNFLTLFQQYFSIRFINEMGGEKEVAFFGIAYRIILFVFLPVLGMARALQPIIGITFGANRHEKAKQTFQIFNLVGFVMISGVLLPILFFATDIIHFSLPDTIVSKEQMLNFYLLMLTLPLLPFLIFSMTFLQAVGKVVHVLILVLLRQMILFIPLIYFFSSYTKYHGVYLSFLVIDVLAVVGTSVLIYFYFETTRSFEEEPIIKPS